MLLDPRPGGVTGLRPASGHGWWHLRWAAAHSGGMNVVGVVLGMLAIVIVILTGILPVIGAIFAWLALVIGVIGLVFGLLSRHTTGRNISIVACVLAALRLALGAGIL